MSWAFIARSLRWYRVATVALVALAVALSGALVALALTGEAPKVDWCDPPHAMPIDRPECWR